MFWPYHVECRILVSSPGIKLMLPALKAWSLTHCTAREVSPRTPPSPPPPPARQTLSILTEDTSVLTWEQGGTGRSTTKNLGDGKYDHYCDDSFLRAYLYQYLSSCVLFKLQFVIYQLYPIKVYVKNLIKWYTLNISSL